MIKQAQPITTSRGHALEWYINFSIVPMGVVQKTLNQIQVRMINEFRKLEAESQCIAEIKKSRSYLDIFSRTLTKYLRH